MTLAPNSMRRAGARADGPADARADAHPEGSAPVGGRVPRRTTLRRVARAAAAALACSLPLGMAATARAASYPEKPINFIVAYAAGGGSDLVVRLLMPYVQKELGEGARIVVQNKAGAGGAIGFAELANAKPDGYTLGLINTPNVLTIPIERKTTFTWQSYDLIGNIVDDPDNFSVHSDTAVRTLGDLVTYARAHPGEVGVGTTGVGSDDHIAMLLFQRAAGVKMTHVPFKGASEVRTAVQGRHIMVAAMNIGEALQFQKSGTPLRNLGTMSVARTTLAPDTPTFREQGFDIVMASLRGVAAPKGLPPEIREKLVTAFARAIADPKFQADAAAAFAPLRYLPPDRYGAELRDAEATFRKLWSEVPWGEK